MGRKNAEEAIPDSTLKGQTAVGPDLRVRRGVETPP